MGTANLLRTAATALGLRRDAESPTASQAAGGLVPPVRQAATGSRALALPAVYRAVSILQTAAMQLTLDATDQSDRAILHRPDPTAGVELPDVLAETVAALALRGNAYWRVYRTSDGRADAIRVLPVDDCTPYLDPATGRRWTAWADRDWSPADLLHLRLLRVSGLAEGLGPIAAARTALTGALSLAAYSSTFTDHPVPAGTLSTPDALTAAQMAEMRKVWNESMNRREVAVLSRGVTFKPVLLSPADLQFIQTREFDNSEIARLFGIPPHLMLTSVEGASLTYQNIQDASLDFTRWTLMLYLREIETAFTKLLPRGVAARFNLDALLRPATRDRYEAHRIGLEAGFLTTAEVREMEGLK